MTGDRVLVTGAFGLVGSAVVDALATQGYAVAATDLRTPANLRSAECLPPGVQVHWADLTSVAEVTALIESAAPAAIVHLAAVIPPFCYANRALAQTVNVEATGHLVAAASGLAAPARFILASSVAVYGTRNPHRDRGLLTAQTPVNPSDLYGAHKVAAERLVTSSPLEWVVLRLGGVLTPTPRWSIDPNLLRFEAVLPSDGRIQTVDVRDVAQAFCAAVSTSQVREVFLIGGDSSHRTTQSAVASETAAAMGLVGGVPAGRPGDPDDDRSWFVTDWMDTERSQQVLGFQRHSLPVMHAQTSAAVGWRRAPLRLVAPIVWAALKSQSPYRGMGGRFADPWRAIDRCWGDPQY
ncbi:oxidoreductase [Mycobacteroides stephanolepidis]|uniref:Oxidoreductase n=1 Tax=[Mycobacterium] stephanolepidis TaxID=1520670 RepID=A0A1Z4F4S2_9MYCO|nr:NAD(P)-dependent oxidoreductase [[Mycobacterium] stephanolepidis]BAY00195.1 oxidoreductase [[Mycobacterium] stephanolepidis]